MLSHLRTGLGPILSMPFDGHTPTLRMFVISSCSRGAYMNIFHTFALKNTMAIQDSNNSKKYELGFTISVPACVH